jgi:hypothetical protein
MFTVSNRAHTTTHTHTERASHKGAADVTTRNPTLISVMHETTIELFNTDASRLLCVCGRESQFEITVAFRLSFAPRTELCLHVYMFMYVIVYCNSVVCTSCVLYYIVSYKQLWHCTACMRAVHMRSFAVVAVCTLLHHTTATTQNTSIAVQGCRE